MYVFTLLEAGMNFNIDHFVSTNYKTADSVQHNCNYMYRGSNDLLRVFEITNTILHVVLNCLKTDLHLPLNFNKCIMIYSSPLSLTFVAEDKSSNQQACCLSKLSTLEFPEKCINSFLRQHTSRPSRSSRHV